jgi:hypothetical protein
MTESVVALAEADSILESDFVIEMVRQLRAIDSYGTYDSWSAERILEPFILSKEKMREIPVVGYASVRFPEPLKDEGRGRQDPVRGARGHRRASERRGALTEGWNMSNDGLKEPEIAVRKAKQIAAERASELQDLVEDRPLVAYAELPEAARAAYEAMSGVGGR